MAINRQDYQYIRNTLPEKENIIGDDSLTIGSKVNNLVVDLNKNTISNPYYIDYYGNHSLQDSWQVNPDIDENTFTSNTQTFDLKLENGEYVLSSDASEGLKEALTITTTKREIYTTIFKLQRVQDNTTISPKPFDGTTSPDQSGILNPKAKSTRALGNMFWWEVDLSNYLYPENYKLTPSGGLVITSEDFNNHTKILKVTGHSEFKQASISIEVMSQELYDVTLEGKTAEVFDDSNAALLTIGLYSAQILPYGNNKDFSCNNEDTKLSFSVNCSDSDDLNITMLIEYASPSYEPTIKEGELRHAVNLKQGKTYVLSVVGVTKPKLSDFTSSIVYQDENNAEVTLSTFDSYLFFEAPRDGLYTLIIKNVGFSYQSFGFINGVLSDLRAFSSPTQAKVYLFESDMPWIINSKGFIVGMKDCNATSSTEIQSTGTIDFSWSDDDIKELFYKAPRLAISSDNQTLRVLLPDAGESTSIWKHFVFWDQFKNDSTKILNNLVLIVYRDYLTTCQRNWGSTRRGVVCTIQRTKTSETDLYSNADGEESVYKIGIKQLFLVDKINRQTTSIDLSIADDSEIIPLEQKYVDFSLYNLSLLGYNHKYCFDNNLCGNEETQIGYKYTTICFAWGTATYNERTGKISKVKNISDFSQPVFIDRQLVSITKDETNYILTKNDDVAIKNTTLGEYYPNEEVIFIGK